MDQLELVNEIIYHHHGTALGFVAGILFTLACYALPSIWHCPTNPFLGSMVQLRKKRSRLAGQNSAFGQFELKDAYGLEQQVLHLDFKPRAMWMNVGFWKNNPQSLSEACQGLLKEILKEAGISASGDQHFSVLEVGCGCAEPAHFFRKEFAETFHQYIGITLNGCQVDYVNKQFEADQKLDQIKAPIQSHVYCADAANPSSWPDSLCSSVNQLVSHQKHATGSNSLWLLAMDTLYHFAPDREQILTHACQGMGASLMATDIIIPDNLTWMNRMKLRIVFFGLQVPWKNIMTQEQYVRMLIRCGYEADKITMSDISEHCFEGFDNFTRQHMEQWKAMGGSNVIPRAVRMMGSIMGWWARSGAVREYVIVAKK